MFQKSVSFLVILTAFTACNPSRYIFKKDRFEEIGQLELSSAIKYDRKLKSKDVTPEHLIQIGESIYPNKNGFELSTPKTYERLENPNFLIQNEYFHTEDDSVKVILYEWNYGTSEKSLAQDFQQKFDYLKNQLTKKLGESSEIEINSTSSDSSFRDGIKWIDDSSPKAYLFMLGNKETNYRQVRLAVYDK